MASNEGEAATFDGEPLDMAWTSDIGDRNVKSTTEYATDPAEQQGDVSFDFLPDGVDEDDLSDGRKKILTVAVLQNPSSVSELAKMTDYSRAWCTKTLEEYAPDVLDDVKMSNADAARRRHNIDTDADETQAERDYTGMMSSPTQTSASADGGDETGISDEFVPTDQHELQRRVDETIAKAETLEKVHPNSVAGRVARELRRSLEVDE